VGFNRKYSKDVVLAGDKLKNGYIQSFSNSATTGGSYSIVSDEANLRTRAS
jgi:hypothetical protein